MADRRMLSLSIVDSDKFLDMSVTARLLYYDLVLRADDDGFVSSPKKVMRIVDASNEDLETLIKNGYIIPQDEGIVVVRHWFVHNTIRSDRYNPTIYADKKNKMKLVNKVYYTKEEQTPKEEKSETKEFIKPTLSDLLDYCKQNGYDSNSAEMFYEKCEKKGWKIAGCPMVEWPLAYKMWYEKQKKGDKND